jgi:hypothetical protein
MADEYDGKHFKLWTPATYCIEVEGRLDESWSDRLAGMRITSRKRADQTTVTSLVGRLRDQAELSGVLNNLYELHLPIISVQKFTEKNRVTEGLPDPDKSASQAPESEDNTQ